MGMYTEFYFRANVKAGDFAEWLDTQINGGGGFESRFDEADFPGNTSWYMPFIGGGAAYQESRRPIFRKRSSAGCLPSKHQLVLASSFKGGTTMADDFVAWISPHLAMFVGDFLGYSLYEDSADNGAQWRDRPVLYFQGREPVYEA